MHRVHARFSVAALAVGVLMSPTALSAVLERVLSDGERQQVVLQYQNGLPRTPISDIVVKGQLILPGNTVYTEKLTFLKGSSIVIDGDGRSDGQPVLIVARTIEVQPNDDGRPNIEVRWKPITPGARGGNGQAGGSAYSEGQPTREGGPGKAGGAGQPGRKAPDLILRTDDVTGGILKISVDGNAGGNGGSGGDGGQGGLGGTGQPASQSMFDCRRGPGRGGDGGSGGIGGNGGDGGRGGDGGSIVVIASDTTRIRNAIEPSSNPGARGTGGEPGRGGPGGPGGRVGQEALPFCVQTASPGAMGRPGPAGKPGAEGEDGIPGSISFLGSEDFGGW